MELGGIAFTGNYLETLPINRIVKYSEGLPKNSVVFTGYPQKHRWEQNKLILINDPLGKNPAILEFKLDDVLHVEEIHQAVTEKGEGVPMVKLWIRQGARGVLLEPFEVDESVNFLEVRREQKERYVKRQSSGRSSAARKTK